MRLIGYEHAEQLHAAQRPMMYILWHGRMMAPVWHRRGRHIVAMVSRHQDGELVSRMVHHLGYETVRGSSTRGGTQAALELLDRLRAGQGAAMICDGPRGPIYKMKPGTPYLAMQSGVPCLPITCGASAAWILRSWDRFMIPKPFARVYIVFGDPILPPPPDSDLKAFTRQLEDVLNELTARADALAGHRTDPSPR